MVMFDDVTFPSWFTGFRRAQEETIVQIVEQFRGGQQVVILSAETGSGKTFIAEMVRRVLANDPIEIRTDIPDERDRCARCNRPLGDELSIERGVGPECANYIQDLPAYMATVRRLRAERAAAARGGKYLPDRKRGGGGKGGGLGGG